LCIALAWGGVCSAADELSVTNLKPDERIVFLTTDARLSQGGRTWIVPIHAWVHEYERSTVRKATFAALLKQKYGLEATASTAENFARRVRLFLVDNERGKRIVLKWRRLLVRPIRFASRRSCSRSEQATFFHTLASSYATRIRFPSFRRLGG
jgi:hypothetical protein